MSHLHSKVSLSSDESVRVTLSKAANIQVMDTHNYNLFKRGKRYRYHGGYYRSSPCLIKPDRSSCLWHVVINGYTGRIRANVAIVAC